MRDTGAARSSSLSLSARIAAAAAALFFANKASVASFVTPDHSDEWIYVSAEQSSSTASVSANAFHTLKVGPDGTLSEPFLPTVLPVTSTPPVRVQGITVF